MIVGVGYVGPYIEMIKYKRKEFGRTVSNFGTNLRESIKVKVEFMLSTGKVILKFGH